VSDPLVRAPKTKHVVQAVRLISAAACVSFWAFSYDGDERNVFRVATEEVHGSDGVEHYVLRANTGPCTPFGMSSSPRKKLAVPVSVNANFWIKNFICKSLPRVFAAQTFVHSGLSRSHSGATQGTI
jgi:hypothetical protein